MTKIAPFCVMTECITYRNHIMHEPESILNMVRKGLGSSADGSGLQFSTVSHDYLYSLSYQ